jgi:hypothetical protein
MSGKMLSKLFEEVVFYISEFFRRGSRRVGRAPVEESKQVSTGPERLF